MGLKSERSQYENTNSRHHCWSRLLFARKSIPHYTSVERAIHTRRNVLKTHPGPDHKHQDGGKSYDLPHDGQDSPEQHRANLQRLSITFESQERLMEITNPPIQPLRQILATPATGLLDRVPPRIRVITKILWGITLLARHTRTALLSAGVG